MRRGFLAVAALAGCQAIVGIGDTKLRGGADGGDVGSDFSLGIGSKSIYAKRGTTAAPMVSITRAAGYDKPVTVTLMGLPSGTSADPLRFAAGTAMLALSVRTTLAADLGRTPLTVSAVSDDGVMRSLPAELIVGGAAGSIDETFASDAAGALPNVLSLTTIAVDAEDRVVVGGKTRDNLFAVARFLRDGAADPSFAAAHQGVAAGPAGMVGGVAVQPDGRIVAAGTSDNRMTVARFMQDGGYEGILGQGAMSTDGQAVRLLRGDGGAVTGIVTAGQGMELSAFFGQACRMPPDGLELPGDLVCRAASLGAGNGLTALAVMADGSIVAGGFSNGNGWLLLRLDSSFAPDEGFGDHGVLVVPDTMGGSIFGLAAQHLTPVIVAAGHHQAVANDAATVVRIRQDGSVVPGGVYEGPEGGIFLDVLVQPDDDIVAVGEVPAGPDEKGYAVRISSDGLRQFAGMLETGPLYAVALQSDGRIVAVGYDLAGNPAVYRLWR